MCCKLPQVPFPCVVSTRHVRDREVLLSDIVPAILVLLNNFKKPLEGWVFNLLAKQILLATDILLPPKCHPPKTLLW